MRPTWTWLLVLISGALCGCEPRFEIRAVRWSGGTEAIELDALIDLARLEGAQPKDVRWELDGAPQGPPREAAVHPIGGLPGQSSLWHFVVGSWMRPNDERSHRIALTLEHDGKRLRTEPVEILHTGELRRPTSWTWWQWAVGGLLWFTAGAFAAWALLRRRPRATARARS
ncbi:MAG TPA: hypothetical protein VFF06_25970 [Polyangia bacterium]|nr:hypothetical protein [Polyangia bacterium]